MKSFLSYQFQIEQGTYLVSRTLKTIAKKRVKDTLTSYSSCNTYNLQRHRRTGSNQILSGQIAQIVYFFLYPLLYSCKNHQPFSGCSVGKEQTCSRIKSLPTTLKKEVSDTFRMSTAPAKLLRGQQTWSLYFWKPLLVLA